MDRGFSGAIGTIAGFLVCSPRNPGSLLPRAFRDLVDRHRQRLTGSGDLPSLKEIELFLELAREIEAQETLERLNALTREV